MKIIDQRHLPDDRPATMDEHGRRVYLFPAAVNGFWRKRRTILQIILIVVFLVLPWIKVGGHQAILLNLADRQFAIFGLTFWAHDTPILFFVLLILAITLALVTAIWGRIWCGWACPQTVFIDGVFRRIEQWTIGNHREQIELAKSPLAPKKIFKYSLKWSQFLIAGLIISHSFIAYFVGVENLAAMVTSNPTQNWATFLAMGFTTFILIFDFTWFREQFCMIMCPYGRFQSILMDKSSLAVLYDSERGEPRGKKTEENKGGDCVDCYRCVSVCPTGIDIRRGLQMECIACTACVDACDEVMQKINKPAGLIRYASYAEFQKKPRKILTLRFALYTIALFIPVLGLTYSIVGRDLIHIAILRAQDKPYEEIQDSTRVENISNHFKIHVKNNTFDPITVRYFLKTEQEFIKLISPINPISLSPGEDQKIPFFLRFSKNILDSMGTKKIFLDFEVYNLKDKSNKNNIKSQEVNLLGPFK